MKRDSDDGTTIDHARGTGDSFEYHELRELYSMLTMREREREKERDC